MKMISLSGKKLVRQRTCPAVVASKEVIPFCIPPYKSNDIASSDDSINSGNSNAHHPFSRHLTASSLGSLNKDLYIVDQYEKLDEGNGTDGFFSSSSPANFPQDNVGRVWFSLTYEESEEKLILSLLKARNLRRPSMKSVLQNDQDSHIRNDGELKRTPSYRIKRKIFAMSKKNTNSGKREASNERRKSDATSSPRKINTLVNIYLLPDKRAFSQAKCKKVDVDPVFADSFVFQLSASDLKSRSLRMIFIEIDENLRHHVIGHVTRPLTALLLKGGLSYADLEKGQPQGSKDSLDRIETEILLSLCYNADLSRLTVVLLRMKLNICPDGNADVEQDIGLKFNVCGKCSKEKKCRTIRRQIGNDNNHTSSGSEFAMNESFRFDLKPTEFESANLTINVKTKIQKQETSSFVTLGGRMFVSGEALDHWMQMTYSANQFVQHWHSLTASNL